MFLVPWYEDELSWPFPLPDGVINECSLGDIRDPAATLGPEQCWCGRAQPTLLQPFLDCGLTLNMDFSGRVNGK